MTKSLCIHLQQMRERCYICVHYETRWQHIYLQTGHHSCHWHYSMGMIVAPIFCVIHNFHKSFHYFLFFGQPSCNDKTDPFSKYLNGLLYILK